MMGIRGLTTLIDNNADLLIPHRLHGCRVVIDGNNLCHSLYYDSRVSCLFGGDYDKFFKRAKDYFVIFQQCDISPVVLFDGALDYSDRKLKTTLSRARDRYAIVRSYCKNRKDRYGNVPKGRILPIMALNVLQNVLLELKIPFAQCGFEADTELAALANYWKCPVLSLDSDFYIFDLNAGLIPLNLIDTHVQQDDENGNVYKYLNCQIYYVDNFLERFNTSDRSVLPLFGTLLGNDFVEIDTFDQFFSRIKIPKVKSRFNCSRRQQLMVALMWWLQSRSKQEAIENVISFFKTDDRKRVRKLILNNVEVYANNSPTLLHVLSDDVVTNPPLQLHTSRGDKLPDWFCESFARASLPPFLLNIIGQQRAIFGQQIEVQEVASSYNISRPIRQVIYGLVRLINDSDKVHVIREFDRTDMRLEDKFVSPLTELPNFGPLPYLENLNGISKDSAVKLLSEVLAVDEEFLSKFPRELQLPFAIVRYWVLNANPSVSETQMNAALLSVLFLFVFQHKGYKCGFRRKSSSDSSISSILMELTGTECRERAKVLKKYCQSPEFTHTRRYNYTLVHSFSQLQTCLLFTSYLNCLLHCPWPALQLERLFNGTFLYNVTVEFEKRPQPHVYFRDLLGENSLSSKVYCECLDVLMKSVPETCLLKKHEFNLKRFKKNKKKAEKRECRNEIDVCEVSDDGEVESEEEEKWRCEFGVDVNNKFQNLMDLDA